MTEGSLRHEIYQALSRLIVIRRGNKAFHPESMFDIRCLTPSVLRIIRSADEHEKSMHFLILAIANKSLMPVFIQALI